MGFIRVAGTRRCRAPWRRACTSTRGAPPPGPPPPQTPRGRRLPGCTVRCAHRGHGGQGVLV